MAARQRKRSLVSLPALAATGLFAVVALSWIVANFRYEPGYGDTPEYWRLSSTLVLDSWRTIGYPLVLRAANVAHGTGLARAAVYTLQTVMSLVALTYFFSVLAQATRQRRNLKRDCLLAILVIITPPLAHLDISILSDSLANSLFMLGAAAIHHVWLGERFAYAPPAVAIVGIVGGGTMRQDRLLVSALVVLGVGAWAVKQRRLQKAAIMGLLLLVCLGVNQFNRHTQSADTGRPAISVPFMAFDRTARTHLSELLPYMPQVIRERITPKDAARWDGRQAYWATIAGKLDDRAGHAAMLRGAAVALRHEGGSIATQVLTETVQSLATPVAYMAQTVFPSVGYTGNTTPMNRHITERTRTLGLIYLWSFIATALLAGLLAARRAVNLKGALQYWGFVVVVNALVNVFSSSVGFHIRYALPIFSIEIALVVWLASRALVPGRRQVECPAPYDYSIQQVGSP
jgi:hypothetical protein